MGPTLSEETLVQAQFIARVGQFPESKADAILYEKTWAIGL